MSFSPAQNALLRTFERCILVDTCPGFLYGSSMGSTVKAQLLVKPQVLGSVGCSSGHKGKTILEIEETAAADVQILKGNQVPACVIDDDVVLQVHEWILFPLSTALLFSLNFNL